MKKNKKTYFHNGFSQTICKFFNIFTLCSQQPTSCMIKDLSYSNTCMMATPVMKQLKVHLSQSQIDFNPLSLSFYSPTFTSYDQKSFSRHLMPEDILDDSKFSTHQRGMIRHVANDNDRTSGHLYREPVSSLLSTSSSSSVSNCHSSLTIHRCYLASKTTTTTPTNIKMLNTSTNSIEKSSLYPLLPLRASTQTTSRFSYLIRPSTPCIFGRETYDDEPMNDDEFFLTAGGIIHSCPNICELFIDDNRKLQSCDHLMLISQQTKLIDNDTLNCYDTEVDRYSILPRFQQNSLSTSTDSIDSELKLYKERHATGFSRPFYTDDISIYSSLLPKTWRSDNYLFLMPFIHHQNSSSVNSIRHEKRSRSYDLPIGPARSSVVA
ncbi:unnamed protein product [Rotaria magnacalcarata]|uniref:Uncharacterized protein n=2 Tax=Rotaria magnacalcarata TaxID=392030 RepID=A0A814DLT9_9BILA|nr:unnamed protein product [Rotaria magnacalcarata]